MKNVLIFKIFKLRGLWEARERPSCIYGRTAFVTSLLVSEVPYSLVCATAYFTLWYFLVGLPMRASTMFFGTLRCCPIAVLRLPLTPALPPAFLLVQIFFLFQVIHSGSLARRASLTSSVSVHLGIVDRRPVAGDRHDREPTAVLPRIDGSVQRISHVSPSVSLAYNQLTPFSFSVSRPYDQMPSYWRWLYHISPFQHYIRSMLGALLHNATVQCGALELVSFDTPAGLTSVHFSLSSFSVMLNLALYLLLTTFSCVKYAAEYLSSHAGYLVNPLSTSTCEFCKASTGDDYLATLNISFDDRWRSLGVLAGYTLSNVVLAYVLFFFPPRLPAPTRWRGRTEVRAELIADEEYEREVAEILAEGTRGPFA
jgi:ATP-binding cassette subfamily G (WHITE) protein 2 (SNQ2)